MSEFKEMVFRLDPYKREEQGAIVEKHLQKLGYTSNESWNKRWRLERTYTYISTYLDGTYFYHDHECEAETFEPIPDDVEEFQQATAQEDAKYGEEFFYDAMTSLKKAYTQLLNSTIFNEDSDLDMCKESKIESLKKAIEILKIIDDE